MLTAAVSAIALGVVPAPVRTMRLADLLAEIGKRTGSHYRVSEPHAEARVIVAGEWEPTKLAKAVAEALRAEIEKDRTPPPGSSSDR